MNNATNNTTLNVQELFHYHIDGESSFSLPITGGAAAHTSEPSEVIVGYKLGHFSELPSDDHQQLRPEA